MLSCNCKHDILCLLMTSESSAADCGFTAAVHGGRRCILDAVYSHRRPSTSFILLQYTYRGPGTTCWLSLVLTQCSSKCAVFVSCKCLSDILICNLKLFSVLPFKGQRCQLVTLCHPGLSYIFNF